MSDATQARSQKNNRPGASATEHLSASATSPSGFQAPFVEVFEKTLVHTKNAHEKVTTILENSTEAFEEALSSASRGSAEYRVKLMEIARTNTNSAFDLAREMLEAKSLPELIEAAVTHQRKQLELAAAQMKELSTLTQKVVTETTEPIRTGLAEPFKMAG